MTGGNLGSLSPTEAMIAEAMSQNGRRLDVTEIHHDTAMSQEAGVDGIDVYNFVKSLPAPFADTLQQVPWDRFSDQRASFYGCQVLLFPFWLMYRLITWPAHRSPIIPPPNGGDERLTVAHLAQVLDRGEWFEPEAMQ